jgi:hypothetical protein
VIFFLRTRHLCPAGRGLVEQVDIVGKTAGLPKVDLHELNKTFRALRYSDQSSTKQPFPERLGNWEVIKYAAYRRLTLISPKEAILLRLFLCERYHLRKQLVFVLQR